MVFLYKRRDYYLDFPNFSATASKCSPYTAICQGFEIKLAEICSKELKEYRNWDGYFTI